MNTHKVIFSSYPLTVLQLWETMSWLRANSIPFLVRRNHIGYQLPFHSPRYLFRLLQPTILWGNKPLLCETGDIFNFLIRERDRVILRMKFPEFRLMTTKIIDHEKLLYFSTKEYLDLIKSKTVLTREETKKVLELREFINEQR